MQWLSRSHGFTIVEAAISLAVLVIGIVGLLAITTYFGIVTPQRNVDSCTASAIYAGQELCRSSSSSTTIVCGGSSLGVGVSGCPSPGGTNGPNCSNITISVQGLSNPIQSYICN